MPDSEQNEIQTVLERNVQSYLADNLSHALGESLTLIGVEVPVSFGRIDILAQDDRENLVAIELKSGVASRDAIAQLQSYMGALELEKPNTFVRGILVAASLDEKAEAALRVARNINFVSYQITFQFKRGMSSPETYQAWLREKQQQSKPPKPLPALTSRFCSNCRAATPTAEHADLQKNHRTYEYKCLRCGNVSVFKW